MFMEGAVEDGHQGEESNISRIQSKICKRIYGSSLFFSLSEILNIF